MNFKIAHKILLTNFTPIVCCAMLLVAAKLLLISFVS